MTVRGSAQRVIANENATALAQTTPEYLTFHAFGSIWLIIKTGTNVGYYVTPEQPITLPPDTYDLVLQDTLPLTAAMAGGTSVWLWGEVASRETVAGLYGDVNLAPPDEPQP